MLRAEKGPPRRKGVPGMKVGQGLGIRQSTLLTVAATGLLVAVVAFGPVGPAWASGRWSTQANPDPGNLGADYFYGVSCASTTWCVAVGDYVSKTTLLDLPLIESWNGNDWQVSPNPIPGDGTGDDALYGVSCVSASSCVAVGQYYEANVTNGLYETLIESWNGTDWSITPSPSPGTVNSLNAVSCVSSKSCMAVGAFVTVNGTAGGTLIESWNGTSWKVTPSPSKGDGDSLSGISCLSSKSCETVGWYTGGTLIESWNGATWKIKANPARGGNQNFLTGISCLATSWCEAVGNDGTDFTSDTLIESWNGSNWKITPSPNQSTSWNDLNGVSCMSEKWCEAVGTYGSESTDASQTLVESWNGTEWTVQSSPNPEVGSVFEDVSCVSSPEWCGAVGDYGAAFVESYG
jgi:hypothetical protein